MKALVSGVKRRMARTEVRKAAAAARRGPAEMPPTPEELAQIAARCRRSVRRRALISAAAAVLPIPGLDLAIDVGLLLRMIDQINTAFGLTPAQIERLSPQRKAHAYQAITMVGSVLIGRIVTRELVLTVLGRIGVRLTASQVSRVVPIAGQALAATLSFGALKILGDRHIEDCVRVSQRILLLSDE
jgi:uncharacterized protein (DUF697 family)